MRNFFLFQTLPNDSFIIAEYNKESVRMLLEFKHSRVKV